MASAMELPMGILHVMVKSGMTALELGVTVFNLVNSIKIVAYNQFKLKSLK